MKNKLYEQRVLKGFSQATLSEMLGISQQTLSSWEIGRTTPKPSRMQQLEDILGLKKECIFFEAFNYKKE